MNNTGHVKNENDSKKIVTTLVLVLTLMICTTSATYAYFALSATNNTMTGTAATANLTLTVTQAALKSTTNSGVMVPQKEATLGTAMNSTNKCLDANSNIICKVYTITITNTSTAAVRVKGTIQFSGNGSMPNLKWSRASSATSLGSYTSVAVGTNTTNQYDISAGTVCTTTNNVDSGCTTISLAKTNGAQTLYIVVWINETGSVQTDNGTWRATITFTGENGTGITSTITSST